MAYSYCYEISGAIFLLQIFLFESYNINCQKMLSNVYIECNAKSFEKEYCNCNDAILS